MLAVALIMCESTETMNSENTSRWLYPIWSAIFGHVSAESWAEIHHLIRKTGHFVGYGLVSLAFFWSWRMTLRLNRRGTRWQLRRRAALLASADEFHQRFLPGRTSSIYDVGIDISGGATAQLLLFAGLALFVRPRQRMREPMAFR
jgi:VanZ family protein